MKDKLKMDSEMVWENIQLIKLLMKGNGLKEKNQEKEKSSLKVEAFFKGISKMMLSKDKEKCITILQEIFSKENGKGI
jgi:hypothetical protein